LVGLCEYDSQLVKDLTLLVKVRRHLENGNQGRNGVIIGLKLLVEDTDAIPKLRVFDVVK
jgi:hypothetical protein